MAIFNIRLEGGLPSSEIWSTGVHVNSAAAIGDVLTSAEAAATAMWADLTTHYGAGTGLTTVVVYELSESTGKATARAEGSLALFGTGTGSPCPQEVAEVASLRTALPGPAGRGRMYMPPVLVAAVNSSGRLDSTTQTALAVGVASFLSALLGDSHQPVLFTPGVLDRIITSVDVGDVFDAQRRRRDKLVENRVSEPVS